MVLKEGRYGKVDMNYSFFSGKEPTDAQLAQLMREACSDAVERAREADVKFEAELENMARQYMAEYKTRYGRT